MVLRGSQTKPEDSFTDLRQQLATAAEDLKIQNDELQKKQQKLMGLLTEVVLSTDEDQVQEKSDPIISDKELREMIRTLNSRIVELETQVQTITKEKTIVGDKIKITMKQLFCGGMAGGCARSVVAPIDRVKILMQTGFLLEGGKESQAGIMDIAKRILNEEGISQFWRGNGVNCVRVFPYAAVQFVSYETYKEKVQAYFESEHFGMKERLLSGSFAGATAASLTHPLDVMRIRLATQSELKGWSDCMKSIFIENGFKGFYKGYAPTVLSLAPFIAVNFSTFDYLKTTFSGPDPNPFLILALGGIAGLTAQTMCYPLDTIRRRMQVKGKNYTSIANAFATIYEKETIRGFYKGMLPNAIKVVPNNGIRFLAYTYMTRWFGVEKRKKS